ncbi:hypothetical protein DFR46_1781 [Parasphingopyxis lamellibrachiae]|uniref:Uncharacterized protein n=1 Tax=Parasphingopyxis lamellibrachiae TaxID=680125 RepID=A0A3D9FI17_9SPHN|nr:hypothetical protein DFR46_1781 [Parasphingopyxis lamellibrachiae]
MICLREPSNIGDDGSGFLRAFFLLARLPLATAQILAQLFGQPFRAFVFVGHGLTVTIYGLPAKAKLDKMACTPP